MKKHFLISTLFLTLTTDSIGQNLTKKVKSEKVNCSSFLNDSLQYKYNYSITKFDKLGNSTKVLKNEYNYSNKKGKLILKVKYDKNKLIAKEEYINSQVFNKKTLTYDKRDSIISKKEWEHLYNSNSFFKQNITRDSLGRKIKINFMSNSNFSKKYKYSHFFIYNENGYLVKQFNLSSKKDTTFIIEYKYNTQGKIIEEVRPIKSFNTGPITKTFLYDENGNLTKVMWMDKLKMDTVITRDNKYQYEKEFYIVEKTERAFSNNSFIGMAKYKYDYNNIRLEQCDNTQCTHYDTNGNIILKITTSGKILIKTDYTYNEKGLVTSISQHNYFKEDNYYNANFTYNSDYKKTMEVHYINNIKNYSETIEYNQDGTLKRKEIIRFNSPTNVDKTVYEYSYEYY